MRYGYPIGKHKLNGMDLLVLPDDDDRVKDLPRDCIGSDGIRFYIPETFWPKLRDALLKASSNA